MDRVGARGPALQPRHHLGLVVEAAPRALHHGLLGVRQLGAGAVARGRARRRAAGDPVRVPDRDAPGGPRGRRGCGDLDAGGRLAAPPRARERRAAFGGTRARRRRQASRGPPLPGRVPRVPRLARPAGDLPVPARLLGVHRVPPARAQGVRGRAAAARARALAGRRLVGRRRPVLRQQQGGRLQGPPAAQGRGHQAQRRGGQGAVGVGHARSRQHAEGRLRHPDDPHGDLRARRGSSSAGGGVSARRS